MVLVTVVISVLLMGWVSLPRYHCVSTVIGVSIDELMLAVHLISEELPAISIISDTDSEVLVVMERIGGATVKKMHCKLNIIMINLQ